MPANRRREKRRLVNGQEMSFQMVHPDKRQIFSKSQRLGKRHTNEQRTDQARPRGHRNAVNTVKADIGLPQRVIQQRENILYVLSRGQLRNYSAVWTVHGVLRRDHIGQNLTPIHNSHGSVIA